MNTSRRTAWRLMTQETWAKNPSCFAFVLDEPTTLAVIRPGSQPRFRGWAYQRDTRLDAALYSNGTRIARTPCNIKRPRVADCVGDPRATECGFDLQLPADTLLGNQLEIHLIDENDDVVAIHNLHFSSTEVPRRMVFMHIPKTAGSTVNAFMAECLGSQACSSHLEGNPWWHAAKYEPPELADKTYLSGHLRLIAIRQKLDLADTVLTTLFRDPLQQLISHIAWVRKLADPGEETRLGQHEELVQRMALDLARVDMSSPSEIGRWINGLHGRALSFFDNCQVRYLAARTPVDKVESEDLHAAIRALESFDLIGLNDRVPAFLGAIAERMNINPPPDLLAVRENAARTKYGLDGNDQEMRTRMEPLYHFDQRLYDAVLRITADQA